MVSCEEIPVSEIQEGTYSVGIMLMLDRRMAGLDKSSAEKIDGVVLVAVLN